MNEQFNAYLPELTQIKQLKIISTLTAPIIVVVDNDPIIADTLRFMAKKNNHVVIYTAASKLFSELKQYNGDTFFFIDYELDADKNGLEILQELHALGYNNLYVMSGHHFENGSIPDYLNILSDKKDILNFFNKKTL